MIRVLDESEIRLSGTHSMCFVRLVDAWSLYRGCLHLHVLSNGIRDEFAGKCRVVGAHHTSRDTTGD
ncbi:hypothetical protein ES702_06084 [subsurface metagenome]